MLVHRVTFLRWRENIYAVYHPFKKKKIGLHRERSPILSLPKTIWLGPYFPRGLLPHFPFLSLFLLFFYPIFVLYFISPLPFFFYPLTFPFYLSQVLLFHNVYFLFFHTHSNFQFSMLIYISDSPPL